MSKQEMQVRVGELARQRRGELGLGAVRFAEAAGIGSDRTIKSFEAGLTSPDVVTQRKLETALGWERGKIRYLLMNADSVDAADIDMAYMDGWAPATRASELEDAEVLAEAIKRLERWQKLLSQDPPADAPAQAQGQVQGRQGSFDLAAYDLPGEKERGMGKPFSEG
jgi:transcriptional regulator with XRE-family HTH domain